MDLKVDRVLRPDETARRLNNSTSTLAKWRMTGDGPRFVKVGRAVRYRQSDIEDWLASRTVSSTAESGLLQRRNG